MSYFQKNPLDITPGIAYEAFNYLKGNPMIPQAAYRPEAAGPASLTGFGSHHYVAQLRQQKPPYFQGYGDVATDVATTITSVGGDALTGAINAVIDSAWPHMEAKIAVDLAPIKVTGTITAVAALTAAVFGALLYVAPPRRQ